MIVFRLIQEKFSPDWEGKGAKLIGRRWNRKGIAMIYTSESRALCTVEIAVHLNLSAAPENYILLTINIPEEIEVLEVDTNSLSDGWNKFPFTEQTRQLGSQLILENRYAVMKVPSAIVPGDFNYLLNPGHKDFGKITKIRQEPYEFDGRFFK